MGKILVPGQNTPQIDPKNPAGPPQVKATVIFQDANYTILKHKDGITLGDIMDLPLHLISIGMGMIDPNKYLPQIGKEKFLTVLHDLEKFFRENMKVKKAMGNNWVDQKPGAKK